MLESINLSELNTFTVFVRLLMAVLMGGAIGLERGISGHHAGMRTYMLVCLGSALVMCTNLFLAKEFNLTDPTRMGAQVVSGIGFLGVGTIIITKTQRVMGLTTAAGLWASGCLGLAIGVGFYSASIIGIVLILSITATMRHVEDRILIRSKVFEVYIEMKENCSLGQFMDYVGEQGYLIVHTQIIPSRFGNQNVIAAQVTIKLPKAMMHSDVIQILQKSETLRYIDEI